MEQAPVGFAFIDAELRLQRISSSLAVMTGGTQAGQLGQSIGEVWPPAVAAAAESAVRSVLATGVPVVNQVTSAGRPSGSEDAGETGEAVTADRIPVPRPGSASDAIAANGNGLGELPEPSARRRLSLSWYPSEDAAGVTMIAVDVTADVAAAEAVRRTNERYRSLVQAGNQVVWVTDPSGQVSEDSPEWRWITGQSVDEYLAQGWLAAIHADDVDRVERDWLSCIKTGTVFDGSYRVRTKTGSYRHYDVRAVPIERDGAIVEWMGASTDVTSQREADEMRGRLHRAAVRRRPAHLQASAGHLAACRGAVRAGSGRRHHRGGPVGDRCRPVGRGAGRQGPAEAAGHQLETPCRASSPKRSRSTGKA